jgi:hypothetical protein
VETGVHLLEIVMMLKYDISNKLKTMNNKLSLDFYVLKTTLFISGNRFTPALGAPVFEC